MNFNKAINNQIIMRNQISLILRFLFIKKSDKKVNNNSNKSKNKCNVVRNNKIIKNKN